MNLSEPPKNGAQTLALEHDRQRLRTMRGILCLLAGVSVVPVMDGIAKDLSASLPVIQITWARYIFNLAIILPFVFYFYGPRSLAVPHLKLQFLRGLVLVLATFSFFIVLSYLPIAETLALAFIYPMVVALFSPFFLGETVGWRRGLAVVVGFFGAVIIIQPGSDLFQPIAILGLVPGVMFAAYIILTRKLAGSAPPAVTLAYGASIGAVLTSLFVPFNWVPPEPHHWLMFISLGLIASFSHILMIKAYESAPASVLAPLGYAEMPCAILIGWLWFGDLPTAVAWLGIVIIVGSGIFISWRETRRE